jgi:hypothetical protein
VSNRGCEAPLLRAEIWHLEGGALQKIRKMIPIVQVRLHLKVRAEDAWRDCRGGGMGKSGWLPFGITGRPGWVEGGRYVGGEGDQEA